MTISKDKEFAQKLSRKINGMRKHPKKHRSSYTMINTQSQKFHKAITTPKRKKTRCGHKRNVNNNTVIVSEHNVIHGEDNAPVIWDGSF